MSAYLDANERAERILIEHLCPQQRLDLAAHRKFYVQGRLNKLYEVEISNGFAIVHPETREIIVKHCCHPEYWMPHADVALATKLAIEAGEDSEAELLQAGRSTLRQHRFRSTREERRAWEMEKHLL